jgi:galactokinase
MDSTLLQITENMNMSPIPRTLAAFQKQFDGQHPLLFRAPGRVNLIGEHTDYNDGFVLPTAINHQIVIASRRRDDRQVNVFSLDFDQWDRFSLDDLSKSSDQTWSNYIRGIAWSLQEDGHTLVGMDAVVAGDIPIGAGLSSSAAIEVATGYALLQLAGIEVDRVKLALAAQRAENDFVGMRCGIMDQYISCLGKANHALLIDCRDLGYESVPLSPEASVIIVDSNVHRGLVDNEYNTRRAECEEAARHFNVPALRDVDEETFFAQADELSPVVRRRAKHVITENARTLAAAKALQANDFKTVGKLMDASHESMRDDFEISRRELDVLVKIAQGVDGVYGARLTGAGFGGCIVALATNEATKAVEEAVKAKYPAATGLEASIYICQSSDGVSEIRD